MPRTNDERMSERAMETATGYADGQSLTIRLRAPIGPFGTVPGGRMSADLWRPGEVEEQATSEMTSKRWRARDHIKGKLRRSLRAFWCSEGRSAYDSLVARHATCTDVGCGSRVLSQVRLGRRDRAPGIARVGSVPESQGESTSLE